MTTTAEAPARRADDLGPGRGERALGWLRQQYPLLLLVGLVIVATLLSDAFLRPTNLSNLARQLSVVGIVALAQLLIVLTGGIDISVGSVLGLAGVLCAGALSGSSVLVAIAVAVGVGLAFGLFNGFLVAYRGIDSFIVTLGVLALARGLVYAYTQGSPVRPADPLFTWAGTTSIGPVPVLAVIWALLAIGVSLLLRRTVFGRRVYALGSNRQAAYASGVPVRATLLGVYALAGALVGLGGFLFTSRVGAASPTAGTLLELDTIAAVVIGGARLSGGYGKVAGAVIGTLIFGVITNLLVLLNVSTFLQDAFRGGLILVAIVLASLGRSRQQLH